MKKMSTYDQSKLIDLYCNVVKTRTKNECHITIADFYTLTTLIKMFIKVSDKPELLQYCDRFQAEYNELFTR